MVLMVASGSNGGWRNRADHDSLVMDLCLRRHGTEDLVVHHSLTSTTNILFLAYIFMEESRPSFLSLLSMIVLWPRLDWIKDVPAER